MSNTKTYSGHADLLVKLWGSKLLGCAVYYLDAQTRSCIKGISFDEKGRFIIEIEGGDYGYGNRHYLPHDAIINIEVGSGIEAYSEPRLTYTSGDSKLLMQFVKGYSFSGTANTLEELQALADELQANIKHRMQPQNYKRIGAKYE